MRLSQAIKNYWYEIQEICEIPERLRQRLYHMGVKQGVKVRVVRRAPIGDPIEIEVKNYFLSIRIDTAKNIKVKVLNNAK